jgi:archaellum component FlaF (FlaF/FlaG flagellin family)
MTTTVIIKAHLSTEKEVHVKITENGSTVEEFVLQDGEAAERPVFDNREISVLEIQKNG